MNKRIIIRSTTISESLVLFDGTMEELQKKYEIQILSSPGEELNKRAIKFGVKTHAVEMYRRLSPIKDLKSLWKIIKVFRKEKPYMVHSMTPKAGLLCMLAARVTKVPKRVHTFTGLIWPTETGWKRKLLMLTDKITCGCASHIIPEGEGVKNDLLNNGITKKMIKVLGYGNVKGVDLNYFSRTEEVENVANKLRENDKTTFLFVGRVVSEKGINELVTAFQQLYITNPQVRLFLVGPFEDSLDPISGESRQIIDSCSGIFAVGLKKGIDLLAYYAASEVFVFPSYREGFPNTVLEAGAMGLPSIVTDINGSREIIKDGLNGLIIPSHDADALYNAMINIVSNPELRNKMSSCAREIIVQKFDQDFVRKCLCEYYEEVINS